MDKHKILLVDDDRLILKIYADYLKDHGFEVTTELSAVKALDRFAGGEGFDLLITDIMMAELDGWSFISEVRDVYKIDPVKMPIIIVSIHYDSVLKQFETFKHNANAYVFMKGGKLGELLRQVNRFLGIGRDNEGQQ